MSRRRASNIVGAVGVASGAACSGAARLPLTVRLRSMVAQPATLDLYDGARLVRRLHVELPAGDRQISTSLPPLAERRADGAMAYAGAAHVWSAQHPAAPPITLVTGLLPHPPDVLHRPVP